MRLFHFVHLKLQESEPELRQLEKLLPVSRRCALDIGANHGHYSVELCKFFQSVVAFEINETLTSDLEGFDKRIRVINTGLSSTAGSATLYIPLRNGSAPLYGWASLEPGNCPGVTEHREVAVKIERLDTYMLSEIDFIKIDVEGHELEVLQGARKTLEENSPVILVEIKDKNVDSVTRFLGSLGYRRSNLEELILTESEENYLFVPEPREGSKCD